MTLFEQKINQLTTKNNDMRGRRTINASPSQAPTDYIIQKELTKAISDLKQQFANFTSDSESTIIDYQPLTANITINVPGVSSKFLYLIVPQDGTGGRTISFNSTNFYGFSNITDAGSLGANTYCAFIFALSPRTNKYTLMAQPIIGQSAS